MPDPMRRVNLVFQGGGIKAIALVGALEALEHDVCINECVGTSAGSIIAALVAGGYQAAEIRELLYDESFAEIVGINLKTTLLSPITLLRKGGLYDASRLSEWVDEKLRLKLGLRSECTFRDLKRPLTVVATDLQTRGAIMFNARDTPTALVGWAVKHSSTIPYLFAPHERDGAKLVDGGLVWNFALRIFDRLPPNAGSEPHPETLGFALEGNPPGERSRSFLVNLIGAVTARGGVDITADDRRRVVAISTRPVGVADFFVSRVEIDFLLSMGRRGAADFTRDYGQEWGFTLEDIAPRPQITASAVHRARRLRLGWRLVRAVAGVLIVTAIALAAVRVALYGGESYVVETYAGARDSGSDDGPRRSARFNGPSGVAVDSQGNVLVADTYNDSIRLIDRQGFVRTYGSAAFDDPFDLAVGNADEIFVADLYQHVIQRVDLKPNSAAAVIEVVAGKKNEEGDLDGVDARFSAPMGLALLASEQILFVADSGNNRVRWIDLETREVHTLIAPELTDEMRADATHTYALDYPQDVKVDQRDGQTFLYIADTFKHRVVRAELQVRDRSVVVMNISRLAYEGQMNGVTLTAWAVIKAWFTAPMTVRFLLPYHLGLAKDGDLFVSDYGNGIVWRIRKPYDKNVEPRVEHVAGGPGIQGPEGFSDGFGSRARFTRPVGLAFDHDGVLYVADDYNNRVRAIRPLRAFGEFTGLSPRTFLSYVFAVMAFAAIYVALRLTDPGKQPTPAARG